jgi:hypothetical protein
MKTDTLKLGVLFFVCFFLANWSHAQNFNYLIIKGLVITEIESTDSCSILISEKSEKVLRAPVEEDGRFRLELKYNTEYKLVFQKSKHHSKTIIVNTKVPQADDGSKFNYSPFLMAVKLASEPELSFEGQVQYVGYSLSTGTFNRMEMMPGADYADKNTVNRSGSAPQLSKVRAPKYMFF